MLVRNVIPAIIAIAVFAACVVPLMAERRTWTDKTGKFTVEAELVEVKNEKVVLKKSNGENIAVALDRLSVADRRYLQSLAKPGLQPSVEAGTRAQLSLPDALTEPPTWNDANPPFDLSEFFQVPPVEENAASLYLEAFAEFDSDEMLKLKLGPNVELPGPEQAKFKRLQAMFRQRGDEYDQFYEVWEKDPQSVDSAAVDTWLANYDTGFEKLAAAQQRSKCVFQAGLSFHALIPHVQVVRQVGRVGLWRTRRDYQRGDLQRPLQDIKILLRLTRDLRVRGVLVTQLVANAVDGSGCKQVLTILNAPGIGVEHCDQLLALLTEHETKRIDAFLEGNRTEYIGFRQALHDLQHRTGSFDPQFMRGELGLSGDVTSPMACIELTTSLTDIELINNSSQDLAEWAASAKGTLLPSAWRGGKMLSDEDYAQEVDTLNRCYKSILALADQPNFWQMGDAEVKAALASLYEPLRKTTLAVFLVPAEESVIWAIRRGDAFLRGTQCLVALRRWQLEHAAPPPDIETLVKAAGMPGVPLDPYSDQPLRMGSVMGMPVIYSVGPDGQDDKAQVEWNFDPREPGDFIFQLEKLPQ